MLKCFVLATHAEQLLVLIPPDSFTYSDTHAPQKLFVLNFLDAPYLDLSKAFDECQWQIYHRHFFFESQSKAYLLT